MLPESLKAVVAEAGWRPVRASAVTLQPPSCRFAAVLDTEGVSSGPQSPRPTEEDEQMQASALFGAGWEHDSVEVLWQDAERAFCRLGCDGPAGERHAFIPVLSGSEHPTLESINRLTHEYELKDSLAGDWALRPVELVREHGRTMLVVEYIEGEPLDRLVGKPMEVGRFLRLAVALSAALGRTPRTWTHSQRHQPSQRDRRCPRPSTCGSPALASPHACRVSARHQNLPRSSPARWRTWRRSRRDG